MIPHDHVCPFISIEIGYDGFARVKTANGRGCQHVVIPAIGSVAVAESHLEVLTLDGLPLSDSPEQVQNAVAV